MIFALALGLALYIITYIEFPRLGFVGWINSTGCLSECMRECEPRRRDFAAYIQNWRYSYLLMFSRMLVVCQSSPAEDRHMCH